MHPELWTIPGTTLTVPTYGFCMALGFGLAIWLGVRRAKRVGADPEVMTSMAAIAGVAGVIGARGMHLVHHHWRRLTGGQMDAEDVASTLSGGGEILGGLVLATGCVIIYLAVTRQSIRRYLDIIAPTVILAMAIGRIGCLM
ncbi:MAG: prolipoprotein diacylglyceryl transferase, partial [Phycisphaerae bacterium]